MSDVTIFTKYTLILMLLLHFDVLKHLSVLCNFVISFVFLQFVGFSCPYISLNKLVALWCSPKKSSVPIYFTLLATGIHRSLVLFTTKGYIFIVAWLFVFCKFLLLLIQSHYNKTNHYYSYLIKIVFTVLLLSKLMNI